MRRLMPFLVLVAVLIAGGFVQESGASFSGSDSSALSVTTDRVQNWLHLYSQSTDPDGLTGYALRRGTTNPAATGVDATLSVNLGQVSRSANTNYVRVLTIKTPSAFPAGTTVTVTASLVADPATGQQPIDRIGFGSIDNKNTYTNPISLGVNEKRQLNLRVARMNVARTWNPKILITVTYTGLTAAYYQYSVPVTVTAV